ncbi:hypothetical protein Syun_024720 [Stephania yunnanensis]|uniref:protein-disulfide reductase n=1 Tax=Stephania yunnanensis TaxID=152371 RepID=A0AAP0EQ94_9MAGN
MDGMEHRKGRVANKADATVLASQGIEFLISAEGEVPLSSLNQKTVCLYFSGKWCRPCRTFTPQLVKHYNNLRLSGRKMEIVFVSFDRDENGFEEHFEGMPWLAVPYNARKRLWEIFRVNSIPSLIPLGSNDEFVEDAVGLIDDYGVDAFPFTRKRREELKAMDDAMRDGGKLDDLLVQGGRDYVIGGDARKVLVSELLGKTIGLYFGAHWCPPCRAFTSRLVEAYNELKITKSRSFEVIFISTDRNEEEFDLNISTMPWLAIPYNDKSRSDLSRIFKIKGIPTLVIIGPDGKLVSTNGKAMISSYGAEAFPFTTSRVIEVETVIRIKGDGLPKQVKDTKHEHLLKLDMAKAYICDHCRKQGRFWVFSCEKCDFDLHPGCIEKSW